MERADRPTDRGALPADERTANAYADGYGEGIKDALRDVLQHASRGHTAQELRWLIESRLARVNEEVELKRRALLGPPRRPAWDALLRPPAAPTPTPSLEATLVGTAVLFQEPRPVRARAYALERWPAFGRLILLARDPTEFPGVVGPQLLRLPLVGSRADATGEPGLDPSELAGRLHELLGDAPALVYLDALDFLVREYGSDVVLRFLEYLLTEAKQRSSLVVVSADPSSVEPIVASRLARLFPTVR